MGTTGRTLSQVGLFATGIAIGLLLGAQVSLEPPPRPSRGMALLLHDPSVKAQEQLIERRFGRKRPALGASYPRWLQGHAKPFIWPE